MEQNLIIYHGSQQIVEVPRFGVGKTYNDYGQGFYCTENIELAKEWACPVKNDGYSNKYILHLDGLNVMHLTKGRFNILNWLALLADNRTYWQNGSIAEEAKSYIKENFLPDISSYDVIIGYRADDSYFAFAQDFVAGVISMQKLAHAMKFGQLGEQIVLKSKKAFEQITYIGNEPVDAEIYYMKKTEREREARREYRKGKKEKADINLLFLFYILFIN